MMVKLYFIYSCYLFIHNCLVITVCWFDNLRRLYSMSLPGIVLTDSLSQRTLSSGEGSHRSAAEEYEWRLIDPTCLFSQNTPFPITKAASPRLNSEHLSGNRIPAIKNE